MLSRRPVQRMNRGRIASVAAAAGANSPTDLVALLGANLFSWHEAESGITLASSMFTPGSSPAVTLTETVPGSGALTQALPIRIDMIAGGTVGTATFAWAADENGAGRTAAVTTAASVALTGTGLTANFAAGTYTATAADTYNAVVAQWEPRYGTTGAAGCRLDNSTVTASPGCIYEAHGLQGGIDRASIKMAPAMLGNQGTMGALPSGAAKPFHMFYLCDATTLPNTTSVLALFGFTGQLAGDTGKNIIDWIVTGTTATPASAHGIQRINSTPTTQRYNGDGTTSGTRPDGTTGLLPAAKPSLSPMICEIEYDGSLMIGRVDGFEVARGSWTGTVSCTRFTAGGVKAGTGAATAFLSHRVSTIVLCNTNLGSVSSTLAGQVRAAM